MKDLVITYKLTFNNILDVVSYNTGTALVLIRNRKIHNKEQYIQDTKKALTLLEREQKKCKSFRNVSYAHNLAIDYLDHLIEIETKLSNTRVTFALEDLSKYINKLDCSDEYNNLQYYQQHFLEYLIMSLKEDLKKVNNND